MQGETPYEIAIDEWGSGYDDDIAKRLKQYERYYHGNTTDETAFVDANTYRGGITITGHPVTQCSNRTYFWDIPGNKMYQI